MKTKSLIKCSLAIAGLTLGMASCDKDSQTEQEIASLEVPEKVIPFNKAVEEYNNFYNTRIAPFQGKSSVDETRAVWFDLEALENHLQKIETVSQEKGIEVTGLSFILGADENNKRTVIIAPMAIHPKTAVDMPFSIDNNTITFLDNTAFDKYSNVTDLTALTNTNQSLLLSTNGYISSADAIITYNTYYDTKVAPFSDIVKNDTRICYYKKGIFAEYIDFLKKQASINNITISGLNIVFGVYNNDVSLGEYANHQTLFLAPTALEAKSNTNESYSFNGKQTLKLDFNKHTFDKIIEKGNTGQSSTTNELSGTPPLGNK